MSTIEITDHLGDHWRFLVPARCHQQANGFWKMWVFVAKGPDELSDYQQIPLPIFTEWWD